MLSSSSSTTTTSQYNNNNNMAGCSIISSASVKRIMREIREMKETQSPDYTAYPLDDNLFEWHFTLRGANGTDFEGGIYHGKIILPSDYPLKPPNILFLTPNGRFEVGVKICLSISAHHPESWLPSWSIRTALVALIVFMGTDGKGSVGALDYPPELRKSLATSSLDWKCNKCGSHNAHSLPPLPDKPIPSSDDNNTSSSLAPDTSEEMTTLSSKLNDTSSSSSSSPSSSCINIKQTQLETTITTTTALTTTPTTTTTTAIVNGTTLVPMKVSNELVSISKQPIMTTTITTDRVRIKPSTTRIDRYIAVVFILLMALIFKRLFY
ncbi:hypothetical protein SAMD00019534_022250, partial [Acytostelium subglobosum LB1]|uniref:hypothetical protein n=1 Tax=Acytostelium subglobosum LB1 TaxID=1410327 RepID=UPI00064509BD